MTAPSAEGAKGDFASAEARRWLSDRPRHPFGPHTLQLGRSPMLAGRGGSVSRRDRNQVTGNRVKLSGGTISAETHTSNASCSSGGSAREGKDSHSRQWRLSMAVFLNRNKRPEAAPIEVAELLSEKPPPSHPPKHTFRRVCYGT